MEAVKTVNTLNLRHSWHMSIPPNYIVFLVVVHSFQYPFQVLYPTASMIWFYSEELKMFFFGWFLGILRFRFLFVLLLIVGIFACIQGIIEPLTFFYLMWQKDVYAWKTLSKRCHDLKNRKKSGIYFFYEIPCPKERYAYQVNSNFVVLSLVCSSLFCIDTHLRCFIRTIWFITKCGFFSSV